MTAERHSDLKDQSVHYFGSIAPDYSHACDSEVKQHVPHLRYISCTPRSLLCEPDMQLMFREDQTFKCCLTCVVTATWHLLLL